MHTACGRSIHIPTIVWVQPDQAPSYTHFTHRLYTELSPLWTSYPPLCTHLSTLIMSNLVLATTAVDKWMASNVAKNGGLDDSGEIERADCATSSVDNSSPFVDKLADLGITAAEMPAGTPQTEICTRAITLCQREPHRLPATHAPPRQHLCTAQRSITSQLRRSGRANPRMDLYIGP